MELVKAKLITIITERLLRHEITDMIKLKGATGYTRSEVEGEGSRGIRASDFEGRNVKIENDCFRIGGRCHHAGGLGELLRKLRRDCVCTRCGSSPGRQIPAQVGGQY